jgi:hypothetical protein
VTCPEATGDSKRHSRTRTVDTWCFRPAHQQHKESIIMAIHSTLAEVVLEPAVQALADATSKPPFV